MNQETLDHLVEIRKRLIYTLLGFGVIFLALFHFSNKIYAVCALPLLTHLPKGTQLIATDITSPFFVPLKLTAIVAFLIAMPNTIYQLWKFITPALYHKEKRLFFILTPSVIILFLSGILFCYFLVLPLIFNFISHIKSSEITMMTDISKYLDFILSLFMIFGFCFETPIIIFLLIHFGVVSLHKMQSIRSYMFVGVFIVAAVLAPPDVLSQVLLALPLYLLYELGMLAAKIIVK